MIICYSETTTKGQYSICSEKTVTANKIAAFRYGYPANLVTFTEEALNEKLHFFMQRVMYKILVCAVSYYIAIFIACNEMLSFSK